MELDDVRAFSRIVEGGSLSAAARSLGIPKSSVSRRLTRLEDDLGVRLLQRTTRTLRLTEAGGAFASHARRILAEVDEARASVSALHDAPRGTLRLSAPPEAPFVTELVSLYLARHPEMQVEAVLTGRFVNLVGEGFDIAIRIGTLADSTLVARRLGSASLVVCASPSYLARHGRPHTPAELAAHACLVFGEGDAPATWALDGPTGTVSVAVSGRLRSNNFELLRDAAVDGTGVALLPGFLAAPALGRGELEPLLGDWHSPAVPVHVVYPTTRHLPARVRAFLDLLREVTERHPELTRWERTP